MEASQPQSLKLKLLSQGVLRILLQSTASVVMLAVPFSEPKWHPSGWEIVPGAVIPALAPILFILLMLDVMMCAVWKADTEDQSEAARLSFSIKTHLTVGAALMLLWFNSFSGALF